jgi:hypothetical protein
MVARILIWSLGDAKTTLDELREHLPPLEPPDAWIANEASERFGVIAFGDELPHDAIDRIGALIGVAPALAEEFDVEEPA